MFSYVVGVGPKPGIMVLIAGGLAVLASGRGKLRPALNSRGTALRRSVYSLLVR